ncbi:MAG: glycosyltransferase family 2 protein [Candidatus Hodarchaeota archaeon]
MRNSQKTEKLSFSIIMANYNNAKYIEESIQSVINQTYSNWELIIVDDCSTDDSLKKIKPFLKDQRIKLIQNKKNLGVGYTKKTAADNASNDVLGVLDSDDKLQEKALETIAKAYYNNPECGLIYSTMWFCDAEFKNCVISKKLGPTIPDCTNIFNPKISHFKTFRKKIYKKTSGYDPNLKASVDKDIIYKLEEVAKLKYIDVPLYYYRHHGAGISQEKNKFRARVYNYIAKCNTYRRRLKRNLPNFTKKELYNEYIKITFNKLFNFAKNFYNLFKIHKIIEFFLKHTDYMPRFVKKGLEFTKKKL